MKYIDEQEKMELGRHLADYLIESGCVTADALGRARISVAQTQRMGMILHQRIITIMGRTAARWCTVLGVATHGTYLSSLVQGKICRTSASKWNEHGSFMAVWSGQLMQDQ